MESKTNWLAVLACTVVGTVIGMAWYGFLFTQQWMAGNGFTQEGEKMFKHGVEVPMTMTPMILNVVVTVIMTLILDWIIRRMGANSWMEGAKVGGAIGLMMFLGVFIGNLFAYNPMNLTFVDGTCSLLTFVLFGAILGGWRK